MAWAGSLQDGIKAYDDGDNEQAAKFWQQACDAGNSEGCVRLGSLYFKGRGVDRDWDKAQALYKKACDARDLRGCNNLASTIYKNDKESADGVRRALEIYEYACKKGLGLSCYNLGEHYESGRGVQRDEARALALYKDACYKAYAHACYELAGLYHEQVLDSEGDMEDYAGSKEGYGRQAYREAERKLKEGRKEAVRFYTLTCKHGGAQGCDRMGQAYEEGLFGVQRDMRQAKKFYDRACKITSDPNDSGYICKGIENFKGAK